MKRFNINTFIISCLIITGVSGCGGGTKNTTPDVGPAVQVNPDLVPVRRIFSGAEVQGPNGFCRLNDDGTDLLVFVKNVGNGASDNSTTSVTFFVDGNPVEVSRFTQPIVGGQTSLVLTFPVPLGCFRSDCRFKIKVDSEGTIPEGGVAGGEGNNTVDGVCIG